MTNIGGRQRRPNIYILGGSEEGKRNQGKKQIIRTTINKQIKKERKEIRKKCHHTLYDDNNKIETTY